MMFAPKDLKPGDELTLSWLNKIRSWCARNTINLGVGSGLAMVQNEQGTFLRVSGSQSGELAITHGSITARVTSTPGTGSVYFVNYDGTSLSTDTSHDIPVLNFSSTSGGISTGVYVWVTQGPGSEYWITAIDCG